MALGGGSKSGQQADLERALALARIAKELIMALQTSPFDPARFLVNDRTIAACLRDIL